MKNSLQKGFTLFEMMLAVTVSLLIILAGILYTRSVYRGHLVTQGEQLILQIITVAQNYHTNANINQVNTNNDPNSPDITGYPNPQYKGISTTWVANTAAIPAQYVQTTGNAQSPLGILTPWSDVPAIDISGGSSGQYSFDCGETTNSHECVNNNSYLAIAVHHLPNYACQSLATRLQQILGAGRQVAGGKNPDIPVTDTECDDSDPNDSTLYIATKPNYY